jgi:hypothetical protein
VVRERDDPGLKRPLVLAVLFFVELKAHANPEMQRQEQMQEQEQKQQQIPCGDDNKKSKDNASAKTNAGFFPFDFGQGQNDIGFLCGE